MVEAQVSCEINPLVPCSSGVSCSSWRDSLQHVFLGNAKIMAETIVEYGVKILHPFVCGRKVDKDEMRSGQEK